MAERSRRRRDCEKINETMKQKAIIVSEYFIPIHKGHLEYFLNAKKLGNELFVIVNNNFQRALKGSKEFQDEKERVLIGQNLKMVDKCFLFYKFKFNKRKLSNRCHKKK
jgi:cytidyltransferase-like protein